MCGAEATAKRISIAASSSESPATLSVGTPALEVSTGSTLRTSSDLSVRQVANGLLLCTLVAMALVLHTGTPSMSVGHCLPTDPSEVSSLQADFCWHMNMPDNGQLRSEHPCCLISYASLVDAASVSYVHCQAFATRLLPNYTGRVCLARSVSYVLLKRSVGPLLLFERAAPCFSPKRWTEFLCFVAQSDALTAV